MATERPSISVASPLLLPNSHDTTPRFPKTDTVFRTCGSEKVVHFLVDVDRPSQVFHTANLGLNQMVAVDGSGDGGLWETSRHELKDRHL